MQELAQRLDELADVRDQPIFVICLFGGRSARATRTLPDADFQAINAAGGMRAWNEMVEKSNEPKGNPD